MVLAYKSKVMKGYQLAHSEEQKWIPLNPDRNDAREFSTTTDDDFQPTRASNQRVALPLRLFEDAEPTQETPIRKGTCPEKQDQLNRKKSEKFLPRKIFPSATAQKTVCESDNSIACKTPSTNIYTPGFNKTSEKDDQETPSTYENKRQKDNVQSKLAKFMEMDKGEQLFAVYEKLLNLESTANRIETMSKRISLVRRIDQQVDHVAKTINEIHQDVAILKENPPTTTKSTENQQSNLLISLLRKLPAQSVEEIDEVLCSEEAESTLVDYFCGIIPDNHTYSDKMFLTLMTEKVLSKLLGPSKRSINKKKCKQIMPASVIRIYEAVTSQFVVKSPWYSAEKMNTHIRVWLSNRRDVSSSSSGASQPSFTSHVAPPSTFGRAAPTFAPARAAPPSASGRAAPPSASGRASPQSASGRATPQSASGWATSPFYLDGTGPQVSALHNDLIRDQKNHPKSKSFRPQKKQRRDNARLNISGEISVISESDSSLISSSSRSESSEEINFDSKRKLKGKEKKSVVKKKGSQKMNEQSDDSFTTGFEIEDDD